MIKSAQVLGKEAATAYLQKHAFLGALAGMGAKLLGQRAGMSIGQRALGAGGSPAAMGASYAPELAQRTREIANPNQWKNTAKNMMPQGVQAANQL